MEQAVITIGTVSGFMVLLLWLLSWGKGMLLSMNWEEQAVGERFARKQTWIWVEAVVLGLLGTVLFYHASILAVVAVSLIVPLALLITWWNWDRIVTGRNVWFKPLDIRNEKRQSRNLPDGSHFMFDVRVVDYLTEADGEIIEASKWFPHMELEEKRNQERFIKNGVKRDAVIKIEEYRRKKRAEERKRKEPVVELNLSQISP